MTRLYHIQTYSDAFGWSTRCTFGTLVAAADLALALKAQGHKVRVTGLCDRCEAAHVLDVALDRAIVAAGGGQ